jgi:hypothetical protein
VFDDVMAAAIYRRQVTAYDPTTGDMAETNTDHTLRVRVESFRSEEVTGNSLTAATGRSNGADILRNDIKVLFPVEDLPITPQTGDQLFVREFWWEIIDYQNEDGANIVWTLQLRRP